MRDSTDRRRLILEESAELFARQGVAATTVREIGDAVGILSGSLYHYFDSKNAIVEVIIADYVDDVVGRSESAMSLFAGDRQQCLAGLVRANFESMARHRLACVIYNNDFRYLKELPRFEQPLNKMRALRDTWVDLLERGIEEGLFRDELDPQLVRRFVWQGIRGTAFALPMEPGPEIEQIADGFAAMVLGGLVRSEECTGVPVADAVPAMSAAEH